MERTQYAQASSGHDGPPLTVTVGDSINDALTPRELTVLTLLAAGDLSEAAIGRQLFVSHSTVHSHVKSIYRKLGANSRLEAVRHARASGVV